LQVGRDTIYYLPAKIVPAIAGFIGIAIYTRLLNPEGYGLYIIVITTVSIISSLFFSWLDSSTLRYFERYKQRNALPRFISTGLFSLLSLFFMVSAIWYLSTVFLNNYLDLQLIFLLRIGILVLGAHVGYSWIQTILRSNRQSLQYSLYSSIESVGRLSLAIFLLYLLPIGPAALLWATFFVSAGIFIVEVIRFLRKWKIHFQEFSRSLLNRFAKYGIPLVGVSVGALILSVLDRYMIQYFLGSGQVGIYSAGYRISEAGLQLFFTVLMLAAFPIIIQSFEKNGEKETSKFLTKLISIYFVFLLPAVLGIAVLSKDIVGVVLGSSFQEACGILPLITGGVFCLGLTQYLNKPFELKERTKSLFYLVLGSSFLNIILNFFWIPKFGIIGAAWATFISYLFYLIISWLKNIKWFLFSSIWKSVVKSILAGIVMYFILASVLQSFPINFLTLLGKILIGGIVYMIMLILLKEENIFKIYYYFRSSFKKHC